MRPRLVHRGGLQYPTGEGGYAPRRYATLLHPSEQGTRGELAKSGLLILLSIALLNSKVVSFRPRSVQARVINLRILPLQTPTIRLRSQALAFLQPPGPHLLG